MNLPFRRAKTTRVPRPQSTGLDAAETRRARIRARTLKLVLIGLSIIATSLLVYGTGPPFTFRLGQKPSRPVLSSVPSFFRRDPQKTNAERRARAEAVSPLLTNDPAPLHEIQEQLDDLVDAIARVRNLADLPPRVVRDWNLDEATFLDIHAASDTPERRTAQHSHIQEAFEPLIWHGVLGPDALPPDEQLHPRVRIRQIGEDPSQARLVDRDQIIPERITKPDGVVAQDFAQSFVNGAFAEKLFGLVANRVAATPTLRFEKEITKLERDAASDSVKDAFTEYRKGDVLVQQDEMINEGALSVLRLEHQTANSLLSWTDHLRRGAAVLAFVVGLFALLGYSLMKSDARVAQSCERLASLCGLFVLSLTLARLLAIHATDAELVPVALGSMIVALAYTPQIALMFAFGLSLLTNMALGSGLSHFIVLMGGTAAAVLPLREVRTRTKPIQVGLLAAIGYFLLTWATGLFQNMSLPLIATDAFWRAGWGLMAGFFLGGLLPFVERGFGIITGISLLELGDMNHPLLQELVQLAPGTHNHSVTVGTVAEAAAKRIGANSLLVRIGAYFHDVGKMLKPLYFVENQSGGMNRHVNLNPAMSTLIIIGHVKDGYDLGRKHHLPQPILDLITQHHGTTLVEYFYREATRRCGDDPDSSSVEESAFRYPGPRPQSKEAGILMIADAVESASRTLTEPTPARLEGLVTDIIRKRLEDGQFDECGLTLKEIAEIRASLVKSLIAIYHGRVKYPEQRTA